MKKSKAYMISARFYFICFLTGALVALLSTALLAENYSKGINSHEQKKHFFVPYGDEKSFSGNKIQDHFSSEGLNTAVSLWRPDGDFLSRVRTTQHLLKPQADLHPLTAASIGLVGGISQQILGANPAYDFNEYDTSTAIIDNLIYAYLSELESQSNQYLAIVSGNSAWLNAASPALFLLLGRVFKPEDLDHQTVMDIAGMWTSRLGVKRTGSLATQCLKEVTSDHLAVEHSVALLFCVPLFVVKNVLSAGPYTTLLADMGCSHGASQLQEAHVTDLIHQGFSHRDANWNCAFESLSLAWLLLTFDFNRSPVSPYALYSGHLLKVCADCTLKGIKQDLLPETGTIRTIMEISVEGILFTMSTTLYLKTGNLIVELFRGKLRDAVIYYAGTRLTRYTAALICTLLLTLYGIVIG